MSTHVIHQPRVIWDAARAFVQAASGPSHHEFASAAYHRLGPEIFEALLATHDYLVAEAARTGGDRSATDLEAGKWRIRLEELLRAQPELTDQVRDLTSKGFES
ncbi:hypothetical protein FB565_001578 [Actinoplanes lutulentus]|uniref:Uncharacterized protein n=1 Tax=Actinoplanes lutulentus TaxID=1287878 RepID=A0A327ZMD0_9ACTN|nr:hypothetical protein [Actinoplanes lutulentus]MBB2941874.1 hypothetical protein [Actinoplanes lutulentus]RAK39791.1 hypothetical protein B0I29_104330 [Actinoplanes lutulentus]